jgi:Cd2+/Zn2+-exporting ATPase
VVVKGTSSVNQAPVTGERVPVDKAPVQDGKTAIAAFDRVATSSGVFAGTINGSGAMDVMVARLASQSTMARVVQMVAQAEAQRSPTQQFTDKFERIFVPVALALVGQLMLAFFVVDEPFSASFYRAMAVLVAASPCALAISVPSAVLSGVARAGRSGVLVKGGGPLENLGSLNSIAFDKTGTLTEGRPRLTDVVAASGVNEAELLSVVVAVESHSDHPLASALVDGGRERLAANRENVRADDVRGITGRGVQASVDGETVYIAKPVLFSELKGTEMPAELTAANDKLVQSGRTTMVVRKGECFLGVIGVMDTPRPAAPGVMAQLRELGIERLVMISGDNQQVADAVARTVGLTEAMGDLMPEQKVETIKALRERHGKVAMVGDGVNDAPAMANATVGIAMGAAGSDVALEAADVALMSDALSQLPFAVGLSRSTRRVIKQNLWVSLGMVAVLIPATIFGLNIGTAVLFHEGSTLLVVINALRLLAYQGAAARLLKLRLCHSRALLRRPLPTSMKSGRRKRRHDCHPLESIDLRLNARHCCTDRRPDLAHTATGCWITQRSPALCSRNRVQCACGRVAAGPDASTPALADVLRFHARCRLHAGIEMVWRAAHRRAGGT